MAYEFDVTSQEKAFLRSLAEKCMEYASLPIMDERQKLWYRHNALKAERPVIVMEMSTFEKDMLPPMKCQSMHAKMIEAALMRHIVNFEMIGDDKVIPPYFEVDWRIDYKPFGIDFKVEHATDSQGRNIAYKRHHPIYDLKEEMDQIKPSVYSVDREYTLAWKECAEEVLSGIMPVKLTNSSLKWSIAPSFKAEMLLGLEKLMFTIMDYPDEMLALMDFIKKDLLAFVKWQENEDLLVPNNGNDYAGAGSYGFTDEIPTEECLTTGKVRSKDLWLNTNSQETVGISPQAFKEFFFPCYRHIANEFGLVYFGCCEPVHSIWEDCISMLPGLRKVSVSPWCDENYMGSVLKGSKVIYSRKPSPNYIGVGNVFDEQGFTAHMTNTLKAAKGCWLEVIFRDIYSLSGDRNRPGKAVGIVRELIERLW